MFPEGQFTGEQTLPINYRTDQAGKYSWGVAEDRAFLGGVGRVTGARKNSFAVDFLLPESEHAVSTIWVVENSIKIG